MRGIKLIFLIGCFLFAESPVNVMYAATPWTGSEDILSGTDYIAQTASQMSSVINIEADGTLTVPNGVIVTGGANSGFNNSGNLIVNGDLKFSEGGGTIDNNPENGSGPGSVQVSATFDPANPSSHGITYNNAPRVISNLLKGYTTLGGPDATTYSMLAINGWGQATLSTSEFTSGDPEIGKFNMLDYGRLAINGATVTLKGNDLALGSSKYDYDYYADPNNQLWAGKLSSIKANAFNLQPESGDTFTLSSGQLYAAGRIVNEDNSPSVSAISNSSGNGPGNLQIDGGYVRLGDSVPVRGGIVSGNIIVGTDTAVTKPDSSLRVESGDWYLNGNLTLNPSGYLLIEENVESSEKGQTCSLTVANRFIQNGGYLTLGGPNANTYSKLILPSADPLTFSTSDFITGDTPAQGKFLMRDYGRLDAYNTTVTLQGNNLTLGTSKYDYDYYSDPANHIFAGKLSSIKANSFNLNPVSGEIFTLSSGQLYTTGEKSTIAIGGGSGTLQMDGSYLRLGQNQQEPGGQIQGNLIVGTNSAATQPDSWVSLVSGDWNLSGDLTLNPGGYLSIVGEYGNTINPRSSLIVAGKFIQNNGFLTLGGPNATVYSILSLPYLEQASFSTNQFITGDTPQQGKILMGDYGRLDIANGTVTLTGDNLALGTSTYDYDYYHDPANRIWAGRLSSIKANSFELNPDTGSTFTLSSGQLYASGRKQGSYIKVGDGQGTLQLDGSYLRLGDSSQVPGGQIQGNVVIGADRTVTKPDSNLFVASGDWVIDGNLTLEQSGLLSVQGGYDSAGNILECSLNVLGRFIENGGWLEIELSRIHFLNGLQGSLNTVINVGGNQAGILQSDNVQMNGGQINFDPPFAALGDTSNASLGGLEFVSDTVDARINIGRNSLVTLGSQDTDWLTAKVNQYQQDTQQLWGNQITAALALRKPQTLSTLGGLNVDGTWTMGGQPAQANTARFAANSLLVVDATGVQGNAALSGNGSATLKVEPGSKLLIADAANGDTIAVTKDFAQSEVSPQGWSENVSTTTEILYAKGELRAPATGEYIVTISNGEAPREAFPGLSPELANVVDRARQTGLDTDSPYSGKRFISRAVDNRYLGANDRKLAAATIESASRMVVLGSVPQMAKAANDAAGAAITQRTGIATPNFIMAVDESGNHVIESRARFERNFSLWIMPLYQSTNGFGMEAGSFSYDFNGALGGVAAGADYTFANNLRAGLSLNIGGGYAQGSGDLNKTTNNMNFWGIGAYAGWAQNNFGVAADVNFTSTYNKLQQDLPSAMAMANLKADVSAKAISSGLRGEYIINTDYLDITPHAGFRYLNLSTDSYDVKSGDTVLHGKRLEQNIWTFPLGVSFSRQFVNDGWSFKPILDLNVILAAGDIKAKTKVRFSGIDQEAEVETKMMDYITYGGTAGIEIGNEVVSFGVDYNGQFGAESSAHSVFGTLRFEF